MPRVTPRRKYGKYGVKVKPSYIEWLVVEQNDRRQTSSTAGVSTGAALHAQGLPCILA